MPILYCRKCNAETRETVADCPRCGCHNPFSCSVCGKDIGMLATIGSIHPFAEDGRPLCLEHARHLCSSCNKPFAREELSPAISNWEVIENLKTVIPIKGNYCASCKASHVEPPPPDPNAKKKGFFSFLRKRK